MDKLWDILIWIAKILPRFVVLSPDEGGVITRFGRCIRVLEEGGHYRLIWPVIHEITTVTTTRQIIDVPTQDVLTKDRIPVCLNVSVEYVINDPYKAILSVEDFDKCIQELTGDVTRELVNKFSFDYCVDFASHLQTDIFDGIEREAEHYGVDVLAVRIPTLTKGYTIRLIQQ